MALSNQSPGSLRGVTPLAYAGTTPNMVFNTRRPTSKDVMNFQLGTWWIIPKKSSNDTNINAKEVWVLVANYEQTAIWERITSSKDVIILPNHSVVLGTGTDSLNSVGPNAASGIPLISQGSSSDPIFGTATVPGGGTGSSSFGINQIVVSGATSTTPLSSFSSGAVGQVLTSAGPGNLPVWQGSGPSGAVTNIKVTVIDTPGAGTYVPTSGMIQVQVECVGGGGAGYSSQGVGNNSGGGGAYCKKIFTANSIGSSQSYFVGAGGTAVDDNPNSSPGNPGQNTTFGSPVLLTAEGGPAVADPYSTGTSTYATATGGDINIPGDPCPFGFIPQYNNILNARFVPGGGNSFLGKGAPFLFTNDYTSLGYNGLNGLSYGGGGGACLGITTFPNYYIGGNGANGVIIITEYLS